MIFTLARMLQGMTVEDVEFATLPGDSPEPRAGQPWYFVHDEEATAQLFYNIRNYCSVETPEEQADEQAQQEEEQRALENVDRSAVTLTVLNGARWEGLAASVAERMEEKGYSDVETGNSKNAYSQTTIYYTPGYEAEARVVAADFDPDGELNFVEDSSVAGNYDADVVLVIGKDYVST
jgi:hypothetical protein